MLFYSFCTFRTVRFLSFVALLLGLVGLPSCTTRAYRFFPSSHHVPGFTRRNQVSAQVGFTNQHLAYSFSDHLAAKASYFSRSSSNPDTFPLTSYGDFRIRPINRTGRFFDTELGLGYFNPDKWYLRELYFGGGFGKTAYHFNPSSWDENQNPYHFYSTNYSVYGQYSIEKTLSDIAVFSLTYKSKWVYMDHIHGTGLDRSPDVLFSYGPGKNHEILWYNQLSASLRNYEYTPFYWQAQLGYSQPNRLAGYKNNRFLWVEFSLGIRLDLIKKSL